VERAWTGLRTEAPDGVPVCGFDPGTPGLLWLAGQSGYGFQTSAAMARAAADLLFDGAVGPWCSAETAAALDPVRFRR
jgi:D-arginine dehydrogenase